MVYPERNNGVPVQILYESEGKFELDSKALHDVLFHPAVGKRPLVVIPVVGAYRTGKSFLLNFFLRYYRNNGLEDSEWMTRNREKLQGFSWKVGCKPHTVGIWMWSEPFIVKQQDKEVAVFLVDTQGHSDPSAQTESRIAVVLSLLMGSFVIYNIRGVVKDSDLKFLETCVEFAEVIREDKDKCPLQNLMLLIRDWRYYDEYSYGLEGGGSYLDYLLSQTLKRISCKLQKTFRDITCFLMPHPGNKVEEPGYDGNIEDISDEHGFIQMLKVLCGHLLNPENLVIKENMTALKLETFIITMFDKLSEHGGKMISKDSYFQLSQDVNVFTLVRETAEKFCTDMDEIVKDGFVAWNIFHEMQREALERAKAELTQKLPFKDPASIKRQRKNLANYVLGHIKTVRTKNEVEELKEGNLVDLVERLILEHKENLEAEMESVELEDWNSQLYDKNMKLVDEAEESYKMQFSENKELYKEGYKQGRHLVFAGIHCTHKLMELEADLEQGRHNYEMKKTELRELDIQGRQQIEADVKFFELRRKILLDIRQHAEVVWFGEKIDVVLQKKKATYEADWEKFKDELGDSADSETMRKKLFEMVDEALSKLENRDKCFQPFAEKKLKQVTSELKLQYLTLMEEKLKSAYFLPDALEKLHLEILKEIIREDGDEDSGMLVFHADKFKKALDEQYKEVKEWNATNKSFLKRVVGGASGGLLVAGATGGVVAAVVATEIALAATGVGAVAGVAIIGGSVAVYFASRKRSKDKFFATMRQKLSADPVKNPADVQPTTDIQGEI